MNNLDEIMADLNKMTMHDFFTYTPMTGEELEISNIKDTIEWAEAISSEWNGDESGSQEDRAHCANEIVDKLSEVIELILGMEEL